jgi:hypothetical protein
MARPGGVAPAARPSAPGVVHPAWPLREQRVLVHAAPACATFKFQFNWF